MVQSVRTLVLTVAALVLFGAGSLVADEIVAASLVMPTSLNIELRVGSKVIARARDLDWPQLVQDVARDFLLIKCGSKSGWARRRDVIEMSAGVEFYSKQISSGRPPQHLDELHRLRADCFAYQRNHEEAIADYTRSIHVSQENAAVYLARAVVLHRTKQYEAAVEDCDQALRLQPKSCDAFCLRARSRASLDQFDDALSDLDAAIKADPRCADALACRGALWIDKGNNERGQADLDRSIAIEPTAERHEIRAMFRLSNHDVEGALADIERGLVLDELSENPSDDHAIAYVPLNKPESIVPEVCRDPKLADTFQMLRVVAYLTHQHAVEALEEIDDLVSRRSGNIAPYLHLRGAAYMLHKDYGSAIDDFNEVLGFKPGRPDVLAMRAECYVELHDLDSALADYDEILQKDPAHAVALLGRGNVLSARSDYDKAIEALNQAVRAAANKSSALTARARVHLAMGSYDKAIADCTQALAAASEKPAPSRIQIDTKAGLLQFSLPLGGESGDPQSHQRETSALSVRGVSHLLKGDFLESAADMSQCLRLVLPLR
jgi:tetratricopeptide (TPR) repeat protein